MIVQRKLSFAKKGLLGYGGSRGGCGAGDRPLYGFSPVDCI